MTRLAAVGVVLLLTACASASDAPGSEPPAGVESAVKPTAADYLLKIDGVAGESTADTSLAARAARLASVLREFPAGGTDGLSRTQLAIVLGVRRGFGEIAGLLDQVADVPPGGVGGGTGPGAGSGSFDDQISNMLNNNLLFLAIQTKVQNISQLTQLLSNIAKADADAKLNAIRNLRDGNEDAGAP